MLRKQITQHEMEQALQIEHCVLWIIITTGL